MIHRLNTENLLNTTNPDLSDCFQHTVLVWIPCAFVCCLTPLQLYYCANSREAPLPWRWLNTLKLVLCLLLIIDSLSLLIYNIYLWSHGNVPVHSANFIYPLLLSISQVNLIVVIFFCQRRGLVTSGIIFITWFLFALCGIPELKSRVENVITNSDDDRSRSIVYIAYYVMVVLSLVLSAFPDRPFWQRNEKDCPEYSSSFLSQITFWWFTSLAVLGWRRPLTQGDLWNLNFQDSSQRLVPLWERYWNAAVDTYRRRCGRRHTTAQDVKFNEAEGVKVIASNKGHSKDLPLPSIFWTVLSGFKVIVTQTVCFRLLCDTLTFVNPVLLSLLIRFTEDPSIPAWRGYFYAALMFISAEVYSILDQQYLKREFTISMNLGTTLTAAVYNKALLLSNASRKKISVGELTNYMAVDVQRLVDSVFFMNSVYFCPYLVILSLIFLWLQLGPAVLAGIAVMVLLMPVNYVLSTFQKKFQTAQMKHKDSRMKRINEILNGIKILKLYAWETSYEKMVTGTRADELAALRKAAYVNAGTFFLYITAPFLVSAVTFAVYVLSDSSNVLTPDKAFVSLALFNILQFPLTVLPMTITHLMQASVSNTRLKKYLSADEIDLTCINHSESNACAVCIKNGNFSWEKGAPYTLKNINLTVERGSLTAVVGTVGCGKSSLLSAMLGEMDKESGSVTLNGPVGYVPQTAWIRNTTLRNNVTFLKDYNEIQYKPIIQACALQPDIDMLPDGDLTEIGEKGINLSGGQKQRISVARAVYQNANIYLLDDPLSAVDSHVGKHIFDNVISSKTGLLKNKTRILVTHSLKYLRYVDQIVVIKDGIISEQGTFDQLLRNDSTFSQLLQTYLDKHIAADDSDEDESDLEILEEFNQQLNNVSHALPSGSQLQDTKTSTTRHAALQSHRSTTRSRDNEASMKQQQRTEMPPRRPTSKTQSPGKLVETEEARTGNVSLNVYNMYLRVMGYAYVLLTIVQFVISSAFSVGTNVWLSDWSDEQARQQITGTSNTTGYTTAMRLGVYAALGIWQGIFIMIGAFTFAVAAVTASGRLHSAMLHNIVRWPMAAFDVTPLGRIVNRFGKDMDSVDNDLPVMIQFWLQTMLNFVASMVVIIASTPIFAVVIVPLFVVYFFVQRFYVATIRQLKRLESVSKSPIFSHFQETVQGASSIRAYKAQGYFASESNRLVDSSQMCRYPIICANRWQAIWLQLVGNAAVLFAALFAVIARDSVGISAGLVGLSVSYAMNTTATLSTAVRITTNMEAFLVSVERIKEYSEKPEEAAYESSNPPAKNWPHIGAVSFENYALRYREQLDLVIRDISFSVHGGEKIGIVGRTGAGKSSLTLALFRLIEAAQGSILVDNVDVSKIGLHELRTRLTIIPQDPVLFSGTLRINLDPLAQFNDGDLWSALEHAHLKDYVSNLPNKLEHAITEGGENLSVGQRQLVCLARALLRKTKILVLDEATASVDMQTDDLIQKTVRQEFADCTILTIAHRLHTILDSTRVLVLDKGRVVEFGKPSELLRDRESAFYAMAADAGIVAK